MTSLTDDLVTPSGGTQPIVDRPRLRALLGPVRPGTVTVIAGPAGFGKTVLAEQWIAAHPGVAVLRVEVRGPGENRFAPGILTELAAVDPADEAILFVDGIDSVDATDLATHGGSPTVLADLVERAPANVHTLVTSRGPWQDRVARLRARGRRVIRVDERDLAFSADEASALVHHVAGRRLSDAQVADLLERTEGWPVGLEVVARDLRSPGVEADAVIAMPRGDDRRLRAYFAANVLDHQSERVRQFLVHTSVLPELSASSCSAVTGDPASRALLQLVEQRGTFVRRVDDAGDRLVCHRLLREVLRDHLRIEAADGEQRLLLRAAAWYAKRGEPATAVPLLVEAEAWDQLIALVDRVGVRTFEDGDAAKAIEWLRAIPASAPLDRVGLGLRLGFLHTMNGRTRVAEQLVHGLEVQGLVAGEQAIASALRASWAFFDGDPHSVLAATDDVRRSLEALDDDELPDLLGLTSRESLIVVADGSRARARWHLGDVGGARAGLVEVMRRPNVYAPWLLHVMGTLALLDAWAGASRAAQQQARQALRVATNAGLVDHPATLDARLALAHVTRERGSQGGAEAFLESAAAIIERSRRPIGAAVLAAERGLWHLAADEPERGLEVLRALRTSGEPTPPPNVAARLRAVEAKLSLAIGDREHARLVLDGEPANRFPDTAAVAVQLAVADGDLERARAALEAWPVDDAIPRAALERDLWTAIVELSRGSRRQALQHGLAVLTRAETEGHQRLFLDAGRPAERLLNAVVNVDPSPYVRGLVASAQAQAGMGRGGAAFGLTERERAVARYLPTPLSSAEIAAQLYISRNTLKTHLQTVYRKLGVSGRQEAIRRAEELGLA